MSIDPIPHKSIATSTTFTVMPREEMPPRAESYDTAVLGLHEAPGDLIAKEEDWRRGLDVYGTLREKVFWQDMKQNLQQTVLVTFLVC